MTRRWFLHPHAHVFLSVLLAAASQVLFKKAAPLSADASLFGLAAMTSGWAWLAILATIGSLFAWLYALRFVPLGVAYNLSGALHVLVPLSCWIFLGEKIVAQRWLGIGLVLAGVLVTAQSAAKIEETIEKEIEEKP